MNERAAYRVNEFAAAIGVHRATVWNWIKKGKLPTIEIGGITFIPAHVFAHIPSTDTGRLIATMRDKWWRKMLAEVAGERREAT